MRDYWAACFVATLFSSVCKGQSAPRTFVGNGTSTRAPAPTAGSCTASCRLGDSLVPIVPVVGWVQRQFNTTIKAAEIIIVINRRTNTTRTITSTIALPSGLTVPPTNSAGSQVVTVTTDSLNGTTTIAFPTEWTQYGSSYNYYGQLPTTTTDGKSVCQSFASPGGPYITLASHPQPGPIAFPTDVSSYNGLSISNLTIPWPSTGDKQGLYYTTAARYLGGDTFFQSVFPQEAAFSNCSWDSAPAAETALLTALLLTDTHTSFEDDEEPTAVPKPSPPKTSPGNRPATTTPAAAHEPTSTNLAGGIAGAIGSAVAQASKTSAAGAHTSSASQAGSGGGSSGSSSSGSGSSNNNGGTSNQGGSSDAGSGSSNQSGSSSSSPGAPSNPGSGASNPAGTNAGQPSSPGSESNGQGGQSGSNNGGSSNSGSEPQPIVISGTTFTPTTLAPSGGSGSGAQPTPIPAFVGGTQTLAPSQPITLGSGASAPVVSLGTNAAGQSIVVVGGSTSVLATASAGSAATPGGSSSNGNDDTNGGLGGAILSGLGGAATAIAPSGPGNGAESETVIIMTITPSGSAPQTLSVIEVSSGVFEMPLRTTNAQGQVTTITETFSAGGSAATVGGETISAVSTGVAVDGPGRSGSTTIGVSTGVVATGTAATTGGAVEFPGGSAKPMAGTPGAVLAFGVLIGMLTWL